MSRRRGSMAREQLGVCAEANLHGNYLLCNISDGHEAILRQKLAKIPELATRLSDHFSESNLTVLVAVSSHYWDTLYPWVRPPGFTAFPEFPDSAFAVGYSTADVLIQIRSDRADTNYVVLQHIVNLLDSHATFLDHVCCFRFLDGRLLNGFLDTPTNPRGVIRRKAALVASECSAIFSAGSYLHCYRALLNQKRWQQLAPNEQEQIMGYRRLDGKPLTDIPVNSLLFCNQQAHADSSARVVQQNMPFATVRTQGTIHINLSASPDAFTTQWRYRLGASREQGYDSSLAYYELDWAAAYFAPSISFLEAAARGDYG